MVDKMILYKDPIFNFTEIFNPKNGMLIRSNILDENGNETNNEPFLRSFPELVDIGIMGKCHVANLYCHDFGVDCYQPSEGLCNNMSFENYKVIIDQCKGKTLQVALGGRGDPNKHENFKEILQYSKNKGIIPNLTTSGINITTEEVDNIKKYCGAVAVSMYSKVKIINGNYIETNYKTTEAIKKLINKNVITNIHYVISKKTIDDIILRLEKNIFIKGVNAIVFLLYKPTGLAEEQYMINSSDNKVKYFFKLLNLKRKIYKFGFDTCFSPMILRSNLDYNVKTIEFCEASKFSCYISPNMKMYPCSFIQKKEYEIDLIENSIINGWFSEKFNNFREFNNMKCKKCIGYKTCSGGCKGDLNQKSCLY